QPRGGNTLRGALITETRVVAVVALLGQLAAACEQSAIIAEEPALWPLQDFAAERSLTLNLHTRDAIDRMPQSWVRVEIGMDLDNIERHSRADRDHAAIQLLDVPEIWHVEQVYHA